MQSLVAACDGRNDRFSARQAPGPPKMTLHPPNEMLSVLLTVDAPVFSIPECYGSR